MIVICEECGKKYRIDAEKIKGKAARFRCKSCNHVITVTKPETRPRPPAPPPPPPRVEEAP
ncbi:MAG: zinc-ribbon domain-containing protein, partial [Deltaproteobacteria bacterium]|nr:zinc-ribbon domain-containing protein [Deltaproteobacteria bacterium]